MSLNHQLAQYVHCAEMVLDGVQVHRVVAVVVGVWAPGSFTLIKAVEVVIPRVRPERSHAQLLEVGEMIDDPAQVASMKTARFISANGFSGRTGRMIVGWISVGKS